MDKKEELEKCKQESLVEVGEDTTKYGEFVSSYFLIQTYYETLPCSVLSYNIK